VGVVAFVRLCFLLCLHGTGNMILRVCAAVIECRCHVHVTSNPPCMRAALVTTKPLHCRSPGDVLSHHIGRQAPRTHTVPAGPARRGAEQSTLCHGAEGQGASVRADACLREVAVMTSHTNILIRCSSVHPRAPAR
jgi:hypothetical protein